MTPRQDVVWLDLNEPLADQIDKFVSLGYSRMPAARGDLNEIAGIAYARDVLGAYAAGVNLVAPPLREPLTVHDGMSVLKLVETFRATGRHMAIVVDEHGSVEGVVTTTDVLEAVTGALTLVTDPADHDYVQRADGSWLIGGMVPIDEAMARLGLRNPKNDEGETADFHTLAGFVLKMLGHLPKAGARFMWELHVFEVVDMDGRRVDKVLVIPPKETGE
jgi:putative hemolysin